MKALTSSVTKKLVKIKARMTKLYKSLKYDLDMNEVMIYITDELTVSVCLCPRCGGNCFAHISFDSLGLTSPTSLN